MPTRLILIRHGETEWNYQGRYSGFTDTGLNEKGRRQARELAKRLSQVKIHKIYSSDMKRVLQFAKIVFKARPLERLSELREMNFGIFEGLNYQKLLRQYPEIYQKWLNNPLTGTIPEGESLNSLARRVRKALAKVLFQNNNKTVAVFTHAGPIRVILCDVLKLDLKEIFKLQSDLASITIIEFVKGRGKVCLLNDTSYLPR